MIKEYKLSEISNQIKSGLTPLRSNSEYWDNGVIPWLKTEQIGEFKIYDTNEKITNQALTETTISIIEKNSIALAMYGEGVTRGKVSIIAKPMTTNQACCNITLNEDLADYRYVYYYLKNSYQRLRNLATGVRKNLNSELIKNFTVKLPDIERQKDIADNIELFDKKIELNESLICYLEEYSQLLFHKWFVDFNFPDKNGQPYKKNGGQMYEVGGKMIPIGWSIEPLKNFIVEISNGDWGEELPFEGAVDSYCIRGADIPNVKHGKVLEIPQRYIKSSKENKKILKHGYIVIEASGGSPTQSTGRTVLIRNSLLSNIEKPLYFSNFSKMIIPKDNYSIFLYLLLNNLYQRDVFFHFEGKTSGIKNLLLNNLIKKLEYVSPSIDILEKFEEQLGVIWDKIFNLGNENEILGETRDLLIKKLIR
jgi:type I restriction enzyme S subunit